MSPDTRAVAAALLAFATTGCIVAPCPEGADCGGRAANGSGGAAASGGSGNDRGSGGGSDDGGDDGDGMAKDAGPDGNSRPPGEWRIVTSNLAGMESECGNMSYVTAKPDENMLIAGIALRGLWASTDGGGSWNALGTGKGSEEITNRTSSILFDPEDPHRYWESGLYNGIGVTWTTDNGATFEALGDVLHVDFVSVDLTDPERKTLLAGGHEQRQKVRRSTDRGATWVNVGEQLPADANYCTYPLIVDSKIHLVGCGGFGGGRSGIFRTTDGGETWVYLTENGGSRAPLVASDGSIYWSSQDNGGMARSDDHGATFSSIVGAGQLKAAQPIELPDGRIVAVGLESLRISSNRGVTWRNASAILPYFDAVGVTYSKHEKAFFLWHFSCDKTVPDDAVMRFDFDYELY